MTNTLTRMSQRLILGSAIFTIMAGSTALAQTALDNDTPVSISGAKSSQTVYQITLPDGASDLTVKTNGGSGDLSLYVSADTVPTTSSADCSSTKRKNNETCSFSGAQSGTFYVMIAGERAYSSTLTAGYTDVVAPPPPPPEPEPFNVAKIAGIGDSITMAFGADCSGNVWLWDLACLLAGDQPEHSWFDGWSSNVESVHDKFKALDSEIAGNKNAAESGAEMLGIGNSNRNFFDQANVVVSQAVVADHVEILLGGNDICNRDCTSSRNCNNPLYTESEWRGAVRAGMDVLMDGMPEGGTVVLGSVPKVQNLRDAGINKETGFLAINCQSAWSTYDICRVVTAGDRYNGERLSRRHSAIASAQQIYNRVLREEAEAYNSNANGKNSRGIEVVSEYVDESTPTAGTFDFTADNINGADCFHPNVATHSTIADFMWAANPEK